MIKPLSLTPVPTFKSFIVRRANEVAPLDAKQVSTLLDEVLDGMNPVRLNAAQRYPDNSDKAAENLFEWACEVLESKLERGLDESEQAHVREQCAESVS